MRVRIYGVLVITGLSSIIFTAALLSVVFRFDYTGLLVASILIFISAVLFLLLICWRLAGWLSGLIAKPINNADFEKDDMFFDELSPFLRHVREQKAELNDRLNEIVKEKTLLDALSKSMNEGLILVDQNKILLSVNRSAKKILGIDESFAGRNILEAVRNADMLNHLEKAIAGQNSELVFEISSRTYQILFSPVDTGALILMLDITEKAKSERLRREFSANVSHELKTPLTVISGYAELIENGMANSGDIVNMAVKIKRESIRLITLIEDIIRLSQLDESVGVKNFENVDLAEIISEVIGELKQRADEARIAVDIQCAEMTVCANRDMMFEMFYNLIDNAIKYNKPGGRVVIRVSNESGKTNISVADTGIGIDKNHLSRIFERFYRVDPSRSKKTGGTGLGLSIVKHIVALHNGTISVESKLGVGTSINISFNTGVIEQQTKI